LFNGLVASYWQIILINNEAMNDICNELISGSISVGGLILAAIALLYALKNGVEMQDGTKKPTGLTTFMAKGYKSALDVFIYLAIATIAVFILFIFLRGYQGTSRFNIFTFSLALLILIFFRAVLTLWLLMGIPNVNKKANRS
jgi:hypothetical protein